MTYQMYCFFVEILKYQMKYNFENSIYYSRPQKEVLKTCTDFLCDEAKKYY